MQILTEEEIRPIIPSLDSAVVVNGLSMILYEPNNFMHVSPNLSDILSIIYRINVSTTITGGAKSFLVQ